jgi:hypothetical protein
LTGKAAFFSPIRPHAAIAKKRQNTIVSRVCLASVPIRLTRFEGSFSRRDFTLWDFMYTLYHHPFCPHSRFIRLALGEHGLDLRLVEERAWERREGFLLLNPAAATPVLMA